MCIELYLQYTLSHICAYLYNENHKSNRLHHKASCTTITLFSSNLCQVKVHRQIPEKPFHLLYRTHTHLAYYFNMHAHTSQVNNFQKRFLSQGKKAKTEQDGKRQSNLIPNRVGVVIITFLYSTNFFVSMEMLIT